MKVKDAIILANRTKEGVTLQLHPSTKDQIQDKDLPLFPQIFIGNDSKDSLRESDCPAWEHIIILLTGKTPKALLSDYGFEEVIVNYPKTNEVMTITI